MNARETLKAVASILAPFGYEMRHGRLYLDGVEVAWVNPSACLVILAVRSASGEVLVRAENVSPKASPSDVAASIHARFARKVAA